MADPYIGEIRMFGFDYAPIGWVFCDGQLLPAMQYQALLAVVGTIYGGDGQNTLGVPNLQGRIPICYGQGYGLTPYAINASGGNATVTLTANQIPNHTHNWVVVNQNGTTNNPNDLYCGIHIETAGKGLIYKTFPSAPTLDTQFAQQTIAQNGGNLGHENNQPYLPVNFCIATEGVFPVRS